MADPILSQRISLIRNSYSNPVIDYLKSHPDTEENCENALRSIRARTMSEKTYNEWIDHVIEQTRNNCDVIGETVFNKDRDNSDPYREFTVPATFGFGKYTKHDSYASEGMLIGMTLDSGHMMRDGLIGSAMSKNSTKTYVRVISEPVVFNFWNSTGIKVNGTSLRDEEKLLITYREVYDPSKCSKQDIPEENDSLSRVTMRTRLELLNIERAKE